jgi:hypothetical protein
MPEYTAKIVGHEIMLYNVETDHFEMRVDKSVAIDRLTRHVNSTIERIKEAEHIHDIACARLRAVMEALRAVEDVENPKP